MARPDSRGNAYAYGRDAAITPPNVPATGAAAGSAAGVVVPFTPGGGAGSAGQFSEGWEDMGERYAITNYSDDPFDVQQLDGVESNSSAFGDAWYSDPSVNPPSADVPVSAPALPATTSAGFDFDKAIASVTNAALAVLKVKTVWNAAKNPPVRTMDVLQGGNLTKTPGSDGYLTLRDSSGAILGREMPARGVPYALADGSMIVNNGNGTFDVIRSNGTRSTVPYSAPSSAVSLPFGGGFDSTASIVVALGVLLGAAWFMSRRRGSR